MANDITAFRLLPEEKHALKVLAAQADMTLTHYVLHILRKHTDLEDLSAKLALGVRHEEQNVPSREHADAPRT